MKKLLFFAFLLPLDLWAGVCGSGTLATTYSPYTNKLDYVCVGGGSGTVSLSTTTAGATNYIFNQNSFVQTGGPRVSTVTANFLNINSSGTILGPVRITGASTMGANSSAAGNFSVGGLISGASGISSSGLITANGGLQFDNGSSAYVTAAILSDTSLVDNGSTAGNAQTFAPAVNTASAFFNSQTWGDNSGDMTWTYANGFTPNPQWKYNVNGGTAEINVDLRTDRNMIVDLNLKVKGSYYQTPVTFTGNAVLGSTHSTVFVNCAASCTQTLPSASNTGQQLIIERVVLSTNVVVTLKAAGTDLIETTTTVKLYSQSQVQMLVSDGTTWRAPNGLVDNPPFIGDLGDPQSAAAVTSSTTYTAPFRITHPVTVVGIGYDVGATGSGTIDASIYDSAGNRVISSGAQTIAGINFQKNLFSSVFVLQPGTYYGALTAQNIITTLTRYGPNSTIGCWSVAGTTGVGPTTITVPGTASNRQYWMVLLVAGGIYQ